MSLFFDLLTGKDYIGLVKQFILKVFIHEEKKFGMAPDDIAIIIRRKGKNGDLEIMTYVENDTKRFRIIPDDEVQKILTS